MKQGRCPLCVNDNKSLCESHLLSEGVYRRVGEDRVVMTPELFISISNHVKDHLLCSGCEQKFGDAEDYVLPLLRQSDTSFPLLERLRAVTPLAFGRAHSLVYTAHAVGINTEKFADYALSTFWRASVHVWKTLNGQQISMPLRGYEEPIRAYLNGETGFPPGIVLRFSVCSDKRSHGMVFAPVEWVNDVYTGYELAVLGVYFTLVVGVQPGASEWKLCSVNSEQRVIFLEDCSEVSRHHYEDLRRDARVARNLSGS